MQSFKITLKIALQASHTVRQAITPLLLDGYTGVYLTSNELLMAGCRGPGALTMAVMPARRPLSVERSSRLFLARSVGANFLLVLS